MFVCACLPSTTIIKLRVPDDVPSRFPIWGMGDFLVYLIVKNPPQALLPELAVSSQISSEELILESEFTMHTRDGTKHEASNYRSLYQNLQEISPHRPKKQDLLTET